MNRANETEDDRLAGGKISSWAPAVAGAFQQNGVDLSTSTLGKSSACPHLEQVMFPKYLSLDCNKLDEFCMGRVTDTTDAGRIYIEALHLKDFLKDTDTLTKEYSKKGRNKRASPSCPPSKKKSRGADAKDTADEKALSQAYWGGVEGKRTWMLSDSEGGIAGTYCQMATHFKSSGQEDPVLQDLHAKKVSLNTESSDEALDILLQSELRLRTLQKTFQLHDKTVMFDNYVCNTDDALPPQDDDFKVLEDLTKFLPSNTQSSRSQNTNPQLDEKDAEKSSDTNKSSLVQQPTTTVDESKPMEEKSNEITSPNKMTSTEISATEQVETSDVKLPPKSGEQAGSPAQMPETNAHVPMDTEEKAAASASPPKVPDNNEVSIGQEANESKDATPTVDNPQDTQTMKQSSEEGDETTPISGTSLNATPQRLRPSSLLKDIEVEETSETLHKRAVLEGKDASLAANKMLSSFRQNRRKFWNASNKSEMRCVWCSSSEKACTKPIKSHNPAREFGVIKDAPISQNGDNHDNELIACASGDDLIQCLECNLIGCRSGFAGGKSHMMLHFLMSGHTYGVTCGESGEIFCMRCGDMVQHECFDRERERVFLEQNHPSFCWQESPINRGINPSSFTVTKEQGYVWRGLLASYPIPASSQFVRTGHFALRRSLVFRGCSTSKMTALGPNALKMALHRRAHANGRLISTPVGLYNLGNTCYMNSTLQCLINCVPFQEAFLNKLAHPYQCCATLRGGEVPCLACKIDKLLLEHFGSSVGIDAIAALEEQGKDVSNAMDTTDAAPKESSPEHRGHPIIPSGFLAEVWKNSNVRHLARHDQHDAQEFYHALIDGLETDMLSYQKILTKMQSAIKYQSQVRPSQPPTTPPQFSIKDIYEGSLRSVLICNQCGCKRSQQESFLNLSLPLKNEFPSQSALASREKMTTRRETSNIIACLKHFTDPETLSDPIYCPSCNKKTTTLKQHTFAKLPRVLCLHLKRFDAANDKKITDFVSYPASNLDMGKYLPHWCEKIVSTAGKANDSHPLDAESPKILYDLFATVNHRGTLHQGHYTSNVKCGDHWYHCNDAFVCHAGEGDGEKEVLAAEGAYMLFYLRKDGK